MHETDSKREKDAGRIASILKSVDDQRTYEGLRHPLELGDTTTATKELQRMNDELRDALGL